MKIKNIKINSYGNIENKQIELNEKINIIKGNNESGKSTLLNYIINMFFGISKNKEGKNISEFKKYKPWTNSEFSGKVKYILDDKTSYEIYRDFEKRSSKIYNDKLEDISDKFNTDKKEGSQFFQEQTGIDKKTYLSTVVSKQQEVKLDNQTQNILVQKIANLAGTGADNISYKKVETKLQDKIRDEIGTLKTSQKPINIIQTDIDKIEKEITRLEPYEERKYELEKIKEKVEENIKITQLKKDIALEIKNAKESNERLEEKINLNNQIKQENENKIKELDKSEEILNTEKIKINSILDKIEKEEFIQKETIDKNIKKEYSKPRKYKNNIIYLLIIIVLIIAISINIFIIKLNIIYYATIIMLCITSVLYLYKKNKKNKELKINIIEKSNQEKLMDELKKIELQKNEKKTIKEDLNNKITMILGQKNLLKENNNKIDNELKKLLENLEVQIKNIKQQIENKYKENIDNNELKNLLNCDNIKMRLQDIENQLSNKKLELNKLEIEEDTIIPQLDNMVDFKEKLESLKEEYNILKKKEYVINITLENLKQAYEEMKTTITPKFTRNLSENINKISNGKYTKVTINDEKGMIVETPKGEYIEADKLSIGTIDQLYFALRLSMINELFNESVPIMLDETFAYFDDKRLESALKYIVDDLKRNQIIIFTCSNREEKILDKLGIIYNLISL